MQSGRNNRNNTARQGRNNSQSGSDRDRDQQQQYSGGYRSQDDYNSDRWAADRSDSDSFSSYDRMDRSNNSERSQQGGAQSQYDRQNTSTWEDHSADYRTPTDARNSYQGFSDRDRDSLESGYQGGYRSGYQGGTQAQGGQQTGSKSRGVGNRNQGDDPYQTFNRPGQNNDRSPSSRTWDADTESGPYNTSGTSHFGKGPKGFKRTDDRIKEEINEILTYHHEIDASEIEINVKEGDVTLSGVVPERAMKHLTEDIVEGCMGVHEIVNQLRVKRDSDAETSTGAISSAKNASSTGKKSSSTSNTPGNH